MCPCPCARLIQFSASFAFAVMRAAFMSVSAVRAMKNKPFGRDVDVVGVVSKRTRAATQNTVITHLNLTPHRHGTHSLYACWGGRCRAAKPKNMNTHTHTHSRTGHHILLERQAVRRETARNDSLYLGVRVSQGRDGRAGQPENGAIGLSFGMA